MVQSNKKDGGGGGTSRHHAAAVAGAGGSGASGTTHGGREREDMVANIHEFVNDPVGEINGTQYHLDFSDMPVECISAYLYKHNLAPQFSKNGLCGVWNDKDRATDPFLLFSAAYAAEQERANGGPSTSATVPSQEPAAAPKKTKKKSSSKRAAAAVDQNDDDDDGGDESERPPPPIKRRNTTTSMSAAAIEESLKMAKEEEDRRKEATESGGGEAAGGGAAEGRAEKVHATDPQSEAQKATTNALELEGDHQQTATGASATKEQDTRDAAAEDDSAGQEGATSTIGAQDEKAAATTDKDTDHGAAQEDEEMADAATAPGSPPTLRRSSRKPVPAGTGTSLAKTHRDTRPSPSPTPSHGSDGEDDEEEEEDDRFRFRPILADIDAAKDVLADRAARHWCETLAAGGGHTVQGPGVNPALAGQVMMGANAGGIMREGEAISEFLYAARLKGSALKIYKDNAALYGQTPAGAYQAYP